MTDDSAGREQATKVLLKDPVMAAFLAWLIPGLGHLYQGRIAKGILFFICIMGTYVYGAYLGGSSQLGYARAVYFSFRNDEWRLPYLCQIGVGLPSMPALVQAMRMNDNKKVLFGGFMAPPRRVDTVETDPNFDQPTLDKLQLTLNRFFELATVYTMIAGLLNVLAIYDALSGPVIMPPTKKEKQPKQSDQKSAKS
ncbi:MAG: DUF6677 family protein [Thermoguttaceae bacterium]